MSAVGVRELRQNLSVYLRRVGEGERFEVTERGRTVAALVPLSDEMGLIDQLVASGRLIPASVSGDLLDLGPPLAPSPLQTMSLSAALDAEREERLP